MILKKVEAKLNTLTLLQENTSYLIVFAIAATTSKPAKLIEIIPNTIPNKNGSIIILKY